MKLQFISPRSELKSYISKIWVFESNFGFANHGTLIAPNAKPKIIIPYKNAITTTDHKTTSVCQENDLCFIGIRDVPVTLATPAGATGSIGIELTTAGAYKFSNVSMNLLTNQLVGFTDLYGKTGDELKEKIGNDEKPDQKINRLQQFLIEQLIKENRSNLLVDYSVNLLKNSHGMMEIKELEKRTGYSKRYLDMLFKDHLGIPPKTLSTILRFQRFYKHWDQVSLKKDAILDLYYDQSHFIKEFKRYTGYTPTNYTHLKNDFGKHF